ncbi:thermonuclease family protein [Deferrisoma camini]|uniref:thermonuclease family protein n=1 Tax=Deferrisoma camini TaxID=1035120 RepID=UPI00046D63B9|nr:thermonuclease family protein [Deferrisoma camini]
MRCRPHRSHTSRKLAVALLLALAAVAAAAGQAERAPIRVVHVIDGDTVVARWAGQKIHVRLLGVDTPEKAREGRPAEPFSRRATEFTRAWIGRAERVDLEVAGDRIDAHGRILGFLWLHVPGRREPVNLSEEILKAGLGRAIRFFDYPGKSRFLALEAEARRARRGIWGIGRRSRGR